MHDESKQARPTPARSAPTREERLAEALRTNLLRRKSLARAKKNRDAAPATDARPDDPDHDA